MSKMWCSGFSQMPTVLGYLLWISVTHVHFTRADLPQMFSVTEGGSPQTYDCNSYSKQFTAINQVRFEQLRAVGVQCNCKLRVPTSSATADTTEVFSVNIEFGLPKNVIYGSFRTCQALGSQLRFEVKSSTTQTKIVFRCLSNDNVILDGGSDNNDIVVTKSPGFSDDVSMTCESATSITTPEMNDTSTVGTTTDPGPAPGNPDDNPDAGQSSDNEGLGGGTIAMIVLAVLFIIAVIVVVAFLLWRKMKKQPRENQPPTGEYPVDMRSDPNAYDNSMFNNNGKPSSARSSMSSLEQVKYADLDPKSLKPLDRPIRPPSTGENQNQLTYAELEWQKA